MPNFFQSNFNGEWSPLMWGRVELARYSTALRTMVNYTPTIQGGARRRAGKEYLGDTNDHSKKTRIEPFSFSNNQGYLFEFTHELLRFRRDGELLADTEVTPYRNDEVFELRTTATNNDVYIAHGSYWTRKLKRVADDDWQLAEMVLENQPFEDTNTTDISLSSSAKTGDVTLTSSSDFFLPEMVGSSFRIEHVEARSVSESNISETLSGIKTWTPETVDYSVGDRVNDGGEFYTCVLDYDASAVYEAGKESASDYPDNFLPAIVALSNGDPVEFDLSGEWTFRTEGNWTGEWLIQESEDDGATWTTRYSMASTNGSGNFTREGNEEEFPLKIRLALASGVAASHLVSFTQQEVSRSGEAEVTTYTTPTEVEAQVKKDFFSTSETKVWAENEWNPRKGYPSQVFFKGDRLCFASGQAVWGSEVDNWENFDRRLVSDTAPFKDVLRTGNQDPIRWVSEQSVTLLGLSSQIRNLTREDGSSALAAGKNISQRQAGRGASNVEPVEIDDFTFYVQAGGRIIRGLSNDYERGVFAAPDMTREAEHVTRGGVVQMAFQLNRVSTLYAVAGSGECGCLVFEPEMEKMGWYRFKSQNGHIESVAVLPTDSEEDEVYFVVRREIDGSTCRYIERMKNDQVRIQDEGIKEDMFYVDCGKTITGVDLTEITGADHLEGQSVQVLGDGDLLGTFVVEGGKVTGLPPSSKITYGIPIISQFWQMPLEGLGANGSTSGSKKRAKEITIDLLNSMGLRAKSSPDDTEEGHNITPRRDSDELGKSEALYSGKQEVRIPTPRDFDGSVFYEASEPYGVLIRSITTKWEQTSQ